ncbi:IclR family transcriptional regulator [Halosolutus gelatinilyticus]|uniref:IclR family transcriptional regulator n=1 Tax=Halosolutus gelatinilyticus TaxID=2931975 RepID=UPI001FF1ED8E|nr:IclR family transcriptional regulator [Halosolutus gelatinilyticus]
MGTKNAGSSGQRINALVKGFNIIEELKETGSTGVSDLAAALDMPTSTVHVHLRTLEELGYLIADDDGYRLSLRFLDIGGRVRGRMSVFSAARSEMIDLSQETGETVGIGVVENERRVELWQIEGEDAINDKIHVGEHTYLHWTSLGKTLLASLSDAEIDRIIDRQGLPEATENTITDRAELFAAVDGIRQQGFAIEDEERKVGIRSVSVPLTDVDGNTVAALGINAPKNRLTPPQCGEYIALLKRKANVISIRYNY